MPKRYSEEARKEQEKWEQEHPELNEEEEIEETDPSIVREQKIADKKLRILDLLEKQTKAEAEISEFWKMVLVDNPDFEKALRLMVQASFGLNKFYNSFKLTVAQREDGLISWNYQFFDKNGKEILYDVANTGGEEGIFKNEETPEETEKRLKNAKYYNLDVTSKEKSD